MQRDEIFSLCNQDNIWTWVAQDKIDLILKRLLKGLKEKQPCVGDGRSTSLFGTLELVKDQQKCEPLSADNKPLLKAMPKVKAHIADLGVFLYNTYNVILIIPPLSITAEEPSAGLSVINAALFLADAEI